MARRCTDCRQDLPETSFYWGSKASGKLRGQCKDCMRARKLKQRDPAWTPACSRCGAQLTERPGSGRRLCAACFDATYDTEDRRLNGAHRIRLKPCSLCGGRKQRFERGEVCSACRPWLRYAASLRQFGLTPAEYVAMSTWPSSRRRTVRAPCVEPPRAPRDRVSTTTTPSRTSGGPSVACSVMSATTRASRGSRRT